MHSIPIATAVLPLLPVDQWWIRIGDYPRLQLLVAYLVALVLLIPFRNRRGFAIAVSAVLVACAIQVFWIYSYLPFTPKHVEAAKSSAAEKQLRVMAANVLQSNQNADLLLELVHRREPDLLVLCEISHRWAADIASLKDHFAFHRVHPMDNGYGIAFYSQLEVSRCDRRAMVKEEIPSIDADIILRDGALVRVFAVHPNPPRPGEDTTKRDAELILVGREVQDDESVIVLGDMNDVGWSRTSDLFQEVSGLLDPRAGRGFYSTFDATSWVMRYPLDYVFHSDDFRVAEMEVLPPIGSDHFPFWIQLSHEPSAELEQSAPDLDAGDREDAADAVEAI
ncbi:Endonuclease/exonuclease/phosphatase [Rhodopirellula maiorica SM1]|uniref:Endonuclease/exonuclease/phosphatase n=1 Tax=Rhodopirellula maiorica SM1 TaxID=1265738 RepID=M5RUG0_9BACT|nr:endonuclease/exonuclease/phosphatase family protein [Rhodopirellula maiorica]EMI17614.1 Endonuclease/exonuclease/phosphatase [Rhodopirellula maiorica SM1]